MFDTNSTRLPIWGIGCNPWTAEHVDQTLVSGNDIC
uniref:Alpha-amanitin proprotein 2 n=2 Tax=Galerina marginata TaxID=109633 RepID=AAMA2_GALM3|nr:RecName: Full=Alpha-amanitin proprotein 2; Contains: RecName: Full=Alpha-amanitin; AltName: Full=Amatoxin; AltName: Full=Gamma-amanitin; Flags: Precursor [Galerina marginata CBS 339.88]AEX26936.1 alpha-amanitin proprotein [Galerina marginata]QKM76216.1 alpha-amanitin [Galerina marginata]